MILEMDFPDQAAIDDCLASPIRPESHAATEAVMTLFDGRFYHLVAEATVLQPASGGGEPCARERSSPSTTPDA